MAGFVLYVDQSPPGTPPAPITILNPLPVSLGGSLDANNFVQVTLGTGLNKLDDALRSYPVFNGLVDSSGNPLAINHYQGSPASSGVNHLIAAQGVGLRIYVIAYSIDATGTVSDNFQDTAGSPVVLTPTRARSTTTLIGNQRTAPAGQYLFATTANKGLDLNLTGSVQENVEIEYVVTT